MAKNLVAAGAADQIEIELAYAIGVAKPVSIAVDTFGTGKYTEEKITEVIEKVFDLRPKAIISELDLKRPIYRQTAAYGHFGRTDIDLPWKRLDKVDPAIHQTDPYGERLAPASLLLRDGTSIITHFVFSTAKRTKNSREPYLVDVVDDRIVLVDDDRIIDEVLYWEKPKFYDKKTSFGTLMQEVVDARPQRFSLSVNQYCHFWDTPGQRLRPKNFRVR